MAGLAAGAIAVLIASNKLIGEPIVLQVQKPALEFMVVAVLGLSALNAVAEELLWRVVLFSELDTRLGFVVASQAISFGAAHWAGIPYGWSGVILAGIFSVALVLIKSRWGLSATLLAHFGADLVIFSVIGWTTIFAPG
ncbi:MAG: CPBP family intramembrane glutamic endopeptidase [Actinomycetota bacterium]